MADAQTKSRCLKAYKAGVPVNALAERFGVTRKTIYRWVKSLESEPAGIEDEPEEKSPARKVWGGRYKSPVYPVNDPAWGTVLKEIIDERGMNAEQLSNRCGVSASTIRAIMSGKRMGNIATWTAFAKALETTLGEIEEAANGR